MDELFAVSLPLYLIQILSSASHVAGHSRRGRQARVDLTCEDASFANACIPQPLLTMGI